MERNQGKNEERVDDDDTAMKRAMNMTVPERIGKLLCRFLKVLTKEGCWLGRRLSEH